MYKIIYLLFYVIMMIKSSNSTKQIELIMCLKSFKDTVKDCVVNLEISNSTILFRCLQMKSLKFLDNMISSNVITLMDGIQLIRYPEQSKIKYQIIPSDFIDIVLNKNNVYFDTWMNHVLNTIHEIISTYILQIDIQKILSNTKDIEEDEIISGRLRRHKNHMLTFMVFGVTALGMILVPMGFQFLAVLGGKALLLAKMALLLASISGLKKIATSGIHYGLYHVPEPYPYGYHDRNEYNHPREQKEGLTDF